MFVKVGCSFGFESFVLNNMSILHSIRMCVSQDKVSYIILYLSSLLTSGPDRHDFLIQAKTCHSVNNVAFDKALMIQSTLINRKVRRGFSTIWVPKYGDFVRGNQLQSLNIW